MKPGRTELPRLLHVGEVNVEETFHGSLLLHRLLRDYDPDRLTIVETALTPSNVALRVPGAKYLHCPLVMHRFFHNRWSKHCSLLLAPLAVAERNPLRRLISTLPFDVLSTVTHGWSWLGALAIAQESQRPAHLILHDDWPTHSACGQLQQGFLRRILHNAYKDSTARFCVSPGMEAAYREATGCAGDVLYPARTATAWVATEPAPHLAGPCRPLRTAYAGTITAEGYPELIASAARALAKIGGKMILYTPMDSLTLERQGIDLHNIEARAPVPSSELVETLRQEADVLFLPMSHHSRWRDNMTLAFPSKLADYTATGLPILVAAPEYSSVAQWAIENPEAVLLVTSPEEAALFDALRRLAGDPALRATLAKNAIIAGQAYFTASRAKNTFIGAITRHA
jgi:hypothetical protein